MGDFLRDKGKHPIWGKLLKSAGAPIPVDLKRLNGPWIKDVLSGKKVVTGISEGGISAAVFNATYKGLGGSDVVSSITGEEKVNALVYDATGITTIPQVKAMYEFFHNNNVRKLQQCSRIVIIANTVPTSIDNAPEAVKGQYEEYCAMQRGVEGFMRSLAKEWGPKGNTVNLLRITDSKTATDKTLLPYLHFLLSDAGAFFTSQVIEIDTAKALTSAAPLDKPLSGKTAIVTGSARGIGEATAKQLAAAGATVVVHDLPRAADAGEALAKSINGKFLGVDMSSPAAPQEIADFIKKELGGSIDIIIHNAGITMDKTIANMKENQWDLVMAINLNAIIKTNELLLAEGLIKEGGRIVALSSIGGIAGNNGQTNYAMTKAGVIGYVKSLSQKIAAKGITINAIAPGFIETQMTDAMPAMTKFFGQRLSGLNQGGQPLDIANMAAFLASPGSAGTTGQTLRVCGGGFLGA
jgi:3-oxoacyl-[acyl-carrier protein] reductase